MSDKSKYDERESIVEDLMRRFKEEANAALADSNLSLDVHRIIRMSTSIAENELRSIVFFLMKLEDPAELEFAIERLRHLMLGIYGIAHGRRRLFQNEVEAIASERGKHAASKRHNAKGGANDKKAQIRAIWATGKYRTRTICAEEEYSALECSFDTARRALRRQPDPSPWPER